MRHGGEEVVEVVGGNVAESEQVEQFLFGCALHSVEHHAKVGFHAERRVDNVFRAVLAALVEFSEQLPRECAQSSSDVLLGSGQGDGLGGAPFIHPCGIFRRRSHVGGVGGTDDGLWVLVVVVVGTGGNRHAKGYSCQEEKFCCFHTLLVVLVIAFSCINVNGGQKLHEGTSFF